MTLKSRKKLFISAILITVFIVAAVAAYLCSVPRSTKALQSSGVEVSYTTRLDALLQQNYLDWYGVSVNSEKEYYISAYSVNGGNYGSNLPSKAFDGNFDTFWETNTVNSADFRNQISVEFNKSVTIDRILFATRRDSQWQKGFPLTATFYTSEDGAEYETAAVGVAEVKNNVVLYTFDEPLNTKYLKFEYTDVYTGMTQHASASELIFLRPEEEIIDSVKNMFADYMQTKLEPQFNDKDKILALKEQLSVHPLYENYLDRYIDRALSVLDGTLMPDYVNRQFTTDPEGRGKFIQQRGDIFDYGQDLHFMFGLSNYMPTGIFGNTGDTITVYVEADEGQPLPKLIFTQFLTTYQYWKGSQIELKRGVNILTVPSFTHTASFTNAGGPMYIINPYTEDEQNTSVKVYIEGGHTFPVFYKGGSEEKFANDITDYVEYYQENKDTAFNIVEVMSDHILVTAQTTRANEVYLNGGLSVQKACEDWDRYMQSLLEFNGVTFDKSDRYYDERVEKLFLNVRVMQPFSSAADAYATGQHIGIRINTGWETVALSGSGFGWGTSHEIGHVIEIGEYRVLEYTNNMVSNFNETVLDGLDSRGDHSKITNLLAPDSVLEKDGIASGGSYDNTYVAWWNIESVFPGYWGRYNNLFRYGVPQGYPSADGMSAVEKQVYYSSIATGIDTGYYFDRYGYRFNGNEFAAESASQAYKDAVSKLIKDGKLSDRQLKFWYVGKSTATLNYKYGDRLAIYDENITVNPLYIGKENGGYRINLPNNSGTFGHLGYEIIENGKVIGFTTSATYFDGTAYEEGYTPRYQIRAYDQRLNATKISDVWQSEKTQPTAKIGQTEFATLAEALSAAKENDTIILLADIAEENLTVDKSVTIINDGKKINILKVGEQNIFNVQQGATLTIEGSASAPIAVDGSNVARQSRVFSSAGSLDISYVNFKNLNGTTSDGTAINLWGAGNTLSLYGCTFTDITGNGRGGAVYVVANETIKVTITECTFTNNSTTGAFNGGALFLGAPSTITDSVFVNNKAATNSGGAIYISGKNSSISDCRFSGNYAYAWDRAGGGALYIAAYCAVENCTFTENSAFTGANGGNGGAVYVASGGATFTSCTFSKNTAWSAGACYIGSGNTAFEDCIISGNSSNSTAGAVFVNWSQSAVSASFDGCTVTDNTNPNAGTIYINYYFYPGYDDWGLGQKLLNFTNSVFEDNASGGATIATNYNWLQLNAEGSTITASVNKKIDLRSGYENLNITLMQDTGTDGEIVKRTSSPMGDNVYKHFFLSDALKIKYRLELGPTGNSLWLRQLTFGIILENNGEITSDSAEYIYGDSYTMPSAPTPAEGYTFKGWQYGDKLYQAGEAVTLVSGNKITAVYEKYSFTLKLLYSDGEGTSAKTYQKGDVINISELAAPADENFAGWLYKGAVYFAGDKILFDGRNDTFAALYNTPATPDIPDNPDIPGGDNEGDGNNDGEGNGGNDGNNDGNNDGDNDGDNNNNNNDNDNSGDNTPDQPEDNSIWLKVVIAVAVAAAAGIAVFIIILIHRKSQKK